MRFVALLVLLSIASLSHADDSSPESFRAFCLNLLNITPVQNLTADSGEAAITLPNASNYTFSRQYYDALEGLRQANKSLRTMASAGFPSLRSRDLYLVAEQWLNGQAALELAGERGDYKFVNEKAGEIASIEKGAFSTSDELNALSYRINRTGTDVNTSEALELQAQARREFADGRFEEAQLLVDSAYEKITQAEAEATRSRALLESTRRTLEVFLEENWQKIALMIAALAILFFLFQKRIRRFMVNAKIRALTAERGVLESMVKALQTDYFDSGKVNELSYHIKTKKFGDLIRNINRQLPLLKEELKKL